VLSGQSVGCVAATACVDVKGSGLLGNTYSFQVCDPYATTSECPTGTECLPSSKIGDQTGLNFCLKSCAMPTDCTTPQSCQKWMDAGYCQ
jgi:hypothetical protein